VVRKAVDANASIANLKAVGGEGVFYFATHAGFLGKAPNGYYALWSGEVDDLDTIAELLAAGDFDQPDPTKPPRITGFIRAKQGYDPVTSKVR